MTPLQISYSIRYSLPPIQQQIEAAVMLAAQDIQNENSTAPDHADRLAWANWAAVSSSVAWVPFGWPVAMNASIMSQVEAEPSGTTVADSDIEFVVNSVLETVITSWVANQPAKSP
jgi:hypothetical protein